MSSTATKAQGRTVVQIVPSDIPHKLRKRLSRIGVGGNAHDRRIRRRAILRYGRAVYHVNSWEITFGAVGSSVDGGSGER